MSLTSEQDGDKQSNEILNAEVGTLRAERDGYKQAYETLNGMVGQLGSERDGYKQAYETLNERIGQLGSERDGYKQAYETLNERVGQLGAERDGYKQAYETLNERVGQLGSERDGYKQAYETLNERVGQLGAERDGYKQAYEIHLAEIGSMRAAHDGYKQAYETLSTEVGRLRMLAGPVMVRSPEEAGQGIGKPSIMVVSLPKSGTVYTGAALATTLGYDYAGRSLTSGTFPKDIVWPEMAQDFARGGMVSTSHLQAEQRNLTLLKRAGITRGVLLVRDLRSALFSWFHYYPKANLHCRKDPHLKDVFPTWSVDEQLDYHISEFFTDAVQWLSEWVDLMDQGSGPSMLVARYEDLVADSDAYIRSILDFYGLSAPITLPPRDSHAHFRSGKPEEWRAFLSDRHIRKMNSLIPDRFWQRFGWKQ